MKVVMVEQMRRIEAASDAAGYSYAAMMEKAGRAVAEAIIARREVRDRRVLVLVGPGNNGGDGLVAARYLAEAGARVACYLSRPRDPAEDENFRLVQERGLAIVLASEDGKRDMLQQLALEANVVVDALLGTGARLPLRGTLAKMLSLVGRVLAARRQASREPLTSLVAISAPVPPPSPLVGGMQGGGAFAVAVDGPSGLDYNSGALDGVAVSADLTVTFAYPKPGHFRFPGAGALGELVVADIGIDSARVASAASARCPRGHPRQSTDCGWLGQLHWSGLPGGGSSDPSRGRAGHAGVAHRYPYRSCSPAGRSDLPVAAPRTREHRRQGSPRVG